MQALNCSLTRRLMNRFSLFICVTLLFQLVSYSQVKATGSVTVYVKNAAPGSPVKLGIPFPKGALYSPDHVRLLNVNGDEIPSQTTQVTTWDPVDPSIKWLWVFFFTDGSSTYTVEYGEEVRKTVKTESPIVFKNNQRKDGFAEINTGPLTIRIDKKGSGFLDHVLLNVNENENSKTDTVATGLNGRGTFLDYINENGTDSSRAVIRQHFIEKGSGPLHAVLRIEGEYKYQNPEHKNSPFVTYIHAYAGKSYLKVYHTITYTGKPDQSSPLQGRQFEEIATQSELIVDEKERTKDPGLLKPYDMIKGAGFGLTYHLQGDKKIRTELLSGNWWEEGESVFYEDDRTDLKRYSVFQTGPDPAKSIDDTTSTALDRLNGFHAEINTNHSVLHESQKAAGWISISGDRFGVSVGIRNMLEEYPKELTVDLENGEIYAYTWSPNEEPMSFERSAPNRGMMGNFATGITKTTEAIYYFHDKSESISDIKQSLSVSLDPPVAHADPSWYGKTGVYGFFADSDNSFQHLERSMQYKYRWMLFNQHWEPWFGMFDYGDVKNYYFREDWYQWANNEPAIDFMWWTNFMRTGEPVFYRMAQASSRHSMDVDNTHWPRPPEYIGDSNSSLDWFLTKKREVRNPYLGMGRRHADEQWISMLSAHVWVTGWLASYYLDGYHRGLEVARLTGDYYTKRVFGKHGLTGRRLYLSIWNLAELADATKERTYIEELHNRVDRLLTLQKQQGGRMTLDRYGYSQNYVSHGLNKYLQMYPHSDIERAFLTHARSLRDVPPIDHDYESYLSSIHPLIMAYDFSGETEFLLEACQRATHLLVDEINQPIEEFTSQKEARDALEKVSHLPRTQSDSFFSKSLPIWSFTMGLRIFGWTHAYSVPYLIDRLQHVENPAIYPCIK